MRVSGEVVKGAGIGRKVGFPTINLDVGEQCLHLDFGVYGCWVYLEDGGKWGGALHFGPKGTFGEKEPHFEVHILDFEGDLYGQMVKVEIGEKLRDVKRFQDEPALKIQIAEDVEKVRGLGYSKS